MIREILSKFTIDKYEHFALASLSAAVLKLGLRWITGEIWADVIAFIIVLSCCIGKEIIYDKYMKKGTPEWLDLWFGILGALVGIV